MSIFRHLPMSDIVNQLDIMVPGKRPFLHPVQLFKQGNDLVLM
jgi:hypothetical protein